MTIKSYSLFHSLTFLLFVFFSPLIPNEVYSENSFPLIRLGLILPLTGPSSSWGQHTKNGALMAYNELSEPMKNKFQLSFEDDQLKPAQAISAFNKLVAVDHINCLLLFGAQSARAVLPISERQRIPSIAITANRQITSNLTFGMLHWLDAKTQTTTLVAAMKERGIKRVAAIGTQHDASVDFIRNFEEQAKSSGIEILHSEFFLPDNSDFKTFLLRVRPLNPDAILTALVPPHLSLFLKQKQALALDMPVWGYSMAENSGELSASGGAMENILYSGPDLSPAFVESYTSQFHSYPEVAAGNGYDIVKILEQAVSNNATTPESLNRFLHNLKDFKGAMGTYSADSSNGFALPAQLKTVRRGQFMPFQAN